MIGNFKVESVLSSPLIRKADAVEAPSAVGVEVGARTTALAQLPSAHCSNHSQLSLRNPEAKSGPGPLSSLSIHSVIPQASPVAIAR